MKQKIVIRVCMCCDKCRSKAMAMAAATDGVYSVALDGEHRDELVVVGKAVDSTALTIALRKKVAYAELLRVSKVKKDDKKPPAAAAEPSNQPPPQPFTTIVCHHFHRVGYACPWCPWCGYY